MAIYVSINKVEEGSNVVKYAFSTNDDCIGYFTINKESGDINLLAPLLGDPQGKIFARAAYKIKRYWQGGELPEQTCWAS